MKPEERMKPAVMTRTLPNTDGHYDALLFVVAWGPLFSSQITPTLVTLGGGGGGKSRSS